MHLQEVCRVEKQHKDEEAFSAVQVKHHNALVVPIQVPNIALK